MASCQRWRTWFAVGTLLTVCSETQANTEPALGDILSKTEESDPVLTALRAMQTTGQQSSDIDKLTLQVDQLRTHLLQYSEHRSDLQKPSVGFMIGVFEHLLKGEDMSAVLGLTEEQTKTRIAKSDTIRSYSASKEQADYSFHIPALPNHEQVEMVELRFLGNQLSRRRGRITLRVQQEGNAVLKQKIYFSSAMKSHALLQRCVSIVKHNKGNVTIKMSMRKSDSKKIQNIEQNLPILVVYSSDQGFLKSAFKSMTPSSNSVSKNSDMNLSIRRKRAANPNRKKSRKRRKNRWREDETCGIHNFKVDFDLIGWGPWIIHPKTYNARVCYGQCPSPISSEYSPTNHVMLQSLMRLKRPLSGPEPCCVPTKLRPLSMLYFEYDDIVVRHHEDMIVDECGCR